MAAKSRGEQRPEGFIIIAQEWEDFVQDYNPDEVVQMIGAAIAYFRDGVYTEFEDRGMKQFLRGVMRVIDYGLERHREKCVTNSYNRYKGICKDRNMEPLPKEVWYTDIYLTKTVDDGQQALTGITTGTKYKYKYESELKLEKESETETELEEEKEGVGEKGETVPPEIKALVVAWERAKGQGNIEEMIALRSKLLRNYNLDPTDIVGG